MIRIDYRNVLDQRVGAAGVSRGQLDQAGRQAEQAVRQIVAETDKHLYRRLPFDRGMVEAVLAMRGRFAPGFANLVVLGIGGSALGNIALQRALNPVFYNLMEPARRGGPRLFVMDNIDPATFVNLLDVLGDELDRTVFNVISKSGETAETAAQFLVVRGLLRERFGARFAERIVATTDARSGTLRAIADREGYATLAVPDGVGGRFGVLSAVGLFSAAMCNIDIESILAGARTMVERTAGERWQANPAAALAAILVAGCEHGQRIVVVMPYADSLTGLAAWFCQLWAESLGKAINLAGREVHAGQHPVVALGATDQHSQLQLYREGPVDKLIAFQEVADHGAAVPVPDDFPTDPTLGTLGGAELGRLLAAEKQATEFALCASGRPNLTVRWPRVDAEHVGQWMVLHEMATSIAGVMLGINPYDQPAVELGKQAAHGLLGRKGEPFESLAAKVRQTLSPDTGHVV